MSSNYFNSITSSTQESIVSRVSRNAVTPRLPTASQLFSHYQKSLEKTADETPPEPKASTPSTPLLRQNSEAIHPRHSRTTSFTSSEASKKPRRTCSHCLKPLRGGRRVKLPLATGDKYYHYDCLTCAACHGHFTELGFATDVFDMYGVSGTDPSGSIVRYLW
ncbi:hypothetical protein DFQ28_006351 [Apophysomyces sp. BC1034]|nr:hypothetical protein DFQ29_000237 [Apophysomyces sp. BC1021]KAG0193128.1 hypothetical protein DFQ28_006351 [Apophysomyces sp. BC1034]